MDPRINLLRCTEQAAKACLDGAIDGKQDFGVSSLKAAAALLKENQVVAFPTETVYGLGANALQSEAVAKIYKTKGRPSDNPLIVHVSSLEMLRRYVDAETIPATYRPLMDKLWPGPLTLIFKLKEPSPFTAEVSAGHPTIAIRIPGSSIARALIQLADVPIAAPSANISGRPSPTCASHVIADMTTKYSNDPDWPGLTILDGPVTEIGVESTIVDGLSENTLRILRVGGTGPDAIMNALKNTPHEQSPIKIYGKDWRDAQEESRPSVPGMKYRHYAPTCPVILLEPQSSSRRSIPEVLQDYNPISKIGIMHLTPSALPKLDTASIPVVYFNLGDQDDSATHAARLFDGLRNLESQNVDIILLECPSSPFWETGVGIAVKERALKAAGGPDVEIQKVEARLSGQ